jgi:hypothetical protein
MSELSRSGWLCSALRRLPALDQSTAQRRRLGWLLVVAALVLLGWTIYLGSSLHGQLEVRDRQVAWVGVDLMQVTGLIATGVLVARRRPLASPVAAASATLILLDAWFDVTTSQGGVNLYVALLMALVVELPAAFLLARLSRFALGWGSSTVIP